jgi:hypothetical protein
MALSVCPAARVATPVDVVWGLLAEPARWNDWIDGRVESAHPAGPLSSGQTIVVAASGFGLRWHVAFRVEAVDPATHQVGMQVALPLGMQLQEHVSCAPLDSSSCRVQYG